jgi:2-keto-3-deoxy-L-rhamnonate aldolase RhmA
VAALVRVPGSEVSVLKRVLDMGAEGIIVPQVRSADEVRRIVAACRYQPNGDRGWGPRRANNYGRQPQDEYVAESNKNLFVSVQIENVDALASLHEIVAVKGLDSVVIGPYDLSASMGLMGQVLHPDVTSAVQAIIAAAHGAGRLVGFGTGSDVAYAAYAISMGADWIQVGCDFTYLIDSADRAFKEVRRLAFN